MEASGVRAVSRTPQAPPFLDLESETTRILEFISRVVAEAGSKGVVVGLSGGVDSSVVACLCSKALGPQNVLGVRMFEYEGSTSVDAVDALDVARQLGVSLHDVDITPQVESVTRSVGVALDRVPLGNTKARLRMVNLYALANTKSLLVAGTGDKSEDLIGYFTKYGDGGVDFLPIAHLYKTQVRRLARHLGLPERIAGKPSSPNLWPGHKAIDEIPIDYPRLDPLLYLMVDLRMSEEETSRRTGIPVATVSKVAGLVRATKHKRSAPVGLEEWPE